MAAIPRDTKREILDAAEAMLQERGFNAFSYHHIAERLGVKNAAIHYHFRSKADLGVAVIERYRRRFARWAERLNAEETDPWRKLEAYFQIYLDFKVRGGKICPSGILQAEYHSIPEEMLPGEGPQELRSGGTGDSRRSTVSSRHGRPASRPAPVIDPLKRLDGFHAARASGNAGAPSGAAFRRRLTQPRQN